MNNPSLAELAAIQGDQELTLPKPLSEGAYAEVLEGMRLLNVASNRIDAAVGALQHCRVPFDVRPFRELEDCLTAAFMALSPVALAQAEAVARAKR